MTFLFDIKYAVRILAKKPLFTLITVIIMALGLALSLYTYSILNTLLFKPLPTKNADSLVMITGGFNYTNLLNTGVEAFCLNEIRKNSQSFEHFAIASDNHATALISGQGTVSGGRKFSSAFAQWTLFDLVDAKPIMGRAFHPDDFIKGAEPVIILGHEVWQNFFSGDPDIINKSVRVDAKPTRIVGVMPEGLAFPKHAEVWQPKDHGDIHPKAFGTEGTNFAYARLKAGVSLAQANAELKTMMAQFKSQYDTGKAYDFNIAVEPFKKADLTKEIPLLIIMCIVVLFILLLTCINVANLLLSKVNERIKEIAVRAALGAPQTRLILQILYESMIICLVAGLFALLLADWGLEYSNALVNDAFAVFNNKPFWWQFVLGVDTYIALLCLMIITMIFTGALPAWRASTGDFNAILRDGTRGALSHKSGMAARTLVISEILFSTVVLVIAATVLTTTYLASQIDYGVDSEKVLVAQIELPVAIYPGKGGDPNRIAFFDKLKRELENTPGIRAVGMISKLPGNGGGWQAVDVEGKSYPSLEARPKASYEVVVAGTLGALGLTLLEGRYFQEGDGIRRKWPGNKDLSDDPGPDESVIISESLAKALHPEGSAIGKRHRYISDNGESVGNWRITIGVVTDVIHGSVVDTSSRSQTIYLTHQSGVAVRMQLAVCYEQSESLARQAIMHALMKIDPDVVIYHSRSYKSMLQEPLWLIANMSMLFLICGLIAILLAATGIYSVVSNSITLRTQEIGVRRALGATDQTILRLFLYKSLRHLFWGISFGLVAAAFAMHKLSETIVIQVAGYYIGFLLVPMAIGGLVLLATYIPTKRSIKMEPAEALYYE